MSRRRQTVIDGIALGVMFALTWVLAETAFKYVFARGAFGIVSDPFTALWLRFALGTAVICAGLGGAVAAVAHRWVAGRSIRIVHGIAAVVLVIPLVSAPEVFTRPLFGGVLLLAVIAVDGLCLLSWWLTRGRWAIGLAGLAGAYALIFVAIVAAHPAGDVAAADPDRPRPPATVPNVLWVVLDTTRADHTVPYGYPRDATPVLQSLADDGVVFEEAYSTAPWTVPSHASMFTGLYPRQHGCQHGRLVLDDTHPTVAELLTAAGYETAIFAGNPWLGARNGLARGFSHVFRSSDHLIAARYAVFGRLLAGGSAIDDKGAQLSNAAFADWLQGVEEDTRPFFAFINYMEPHYPYADIPASARRRYLDDDLSDDALTALDAAVGEWIYGRPPDFRRLTEEERRRVIALYDAGIWDADQRLGEVIALLRERDLLERTLVIVTADHGELFGYRDTYWGHDRNVHHDLVRVPLVMRWPNAARAGTRVARPVQLIDVMPTVLAAARIDLPGGLPGIPLTRDGPAKRLIVTQYGQPTLPWLVAQLRDEGFDPDAFSLTAAQLGSKRLVRSPKGDELFDVASDPEQRTDLAEQDPTALQALRERLARFDAGHPPAFDLDAAPAGQLSPAEESALRSLGYVE